MLKRVRSIVTAGLDAFSRFHPAGWWRPELLPKFLRNSPKPSRNPATGVLRIGRSTVDLQSGLVTGSDGSTTTLRPKTAALLQTLAARPGEVIAKRELLDLVWPSSFIDEDGLVQCVGEIRRALAPEDRAALRTHARRGYSLHLDRGAFRAAWLSMPWLRYAMLAAAVVAVGAAGLAAGGTALLRNPEPAQTRTPVLAVFPFEPYPGGTRWERLARAFTQDVIADLAQNSWLFVLADATTRSRGPGSPEDAAELGADFFVTGSIHVEDGAARIAADLIETGTGRQLWSKRLEGPSSEILDLQRTASEALVGELSANWSGPIAQAGRTAARQRGIDDLDAYELYLLATERVNSYRPEDLAAAADMYRQVIAMAPEFGEAWAKLSLTTYNMVTPEMSTEEMERMWEQGHAAALEGYRIAPYNPHTMAQAANAIRWDNPMEAERMVLRAAELAPNDADILAYLTFRATHYPALAPDAVEWIDRAFRLNPNHPDWYHWNHGAVLMVVGRYAEAVDAFALAPDHIEVKADRIAALALAGDVPAAQEMLQQLLAEEPQFSITFHANAAGFETSVAEIFARGLRLAGAPE